MPAGRPSDYSDELVRKARLYVDGGYEKEGDVIPTIAGLAEVIGICRDTVYDWIKDEQKEEFSYIVKRLLQRQERTTINGSLKGDLNPVISKLLLAKHGYADKQDVESKGSLTVTVQKFAADD